MNTKQWDLNKNNRFRYLFSFFCIGYDWHDIKGWLRKTEIKNELPISYHLFLTRKITFAVIAQVPQLKTNVVGMSYLEKIPFLIVNTNNQNRNYYFHKY